MKCVQYPLKTALTTATLSAYLTDDRDLAGDVAKPALIICPGGGYRHLTTRTSEVVALYFLSHGIQPFILQYSCKPVHYPAQLLEAAEAVKTVRDHASEWHVQPAQIIIGGFSAGGHLAANLATAWCEPLLAQYYANPKQIRPDAVMMGYAVVSAADPTSHRCFNSLLGDGDQNQALLAETSVDLHVRSNTPPTFIWATTTDKRISVNNSLQYATALQHAKVPFALYLFPMGSHGLGMAIPEMARLADEPQPAADVQQWPALFLDWVQEVVTQKKE